MKFQLLGSGYLIDSTTRASLIAGLPLAIRQLEIAASPAISMTAESLDKAWRALQQPQHIMAYIEAPQPIDGEIVEAHHV